MIHTIEKLVIETIVSAVGDHLLLIDRLEYGGLISGTDQQESKRRVAIALRTLANILDSQDP